MDIDGYVGFAKKAAERRFLEHKQELRDVTVNLVSWR